MRVFEKASILKITNVIVQLKQKFSTAKRNRKIEEDWTDTKRFKRRFDVHKVVIEHY